MQVSGYKFQGIIAQHSLQPVTCNLWHFEIYSLKLLKNITIPAWLKNKYFLTALVFAVWLLFFDDRDIITTHFKYRNELKQLEKSRDYYLQQIDTTKKELEGLKQSPDKLEKYAREKYLMKKDNEDLFISPE